MDLTTQDTKPLASAIHLQDSIQCQQGKTTKLETRETSQVKHCDEYQII